MANHQEKILLTKEQETLLIPLYSKVNESQRPNPIFVDEKSREVLDQVEYDFANLEVPRKTTITLCLRAKKLDAYAHEFLAAQPGGVVLHLGCGPDSRYLRVNNGQVDWYDLDLPDVIDLRRKFFVETDQYRLIPSSVTDWRWLDRVAAQGRPVLVMAEGLLMYLKEADVKALVLKLKSAFPGCKLACDAYSLLTTSKANAHPSLKKTGAVIQWGPADAKTLESWSAGIHLKEEWYFVQAEEISRLGLVYRSLFKLAGLFSVANKAHRILYYDL